MKHALLTLLLSSPSVGAQELLAQWDSPDAGQPEREIRPSVALDGDLLAVGTLDPAGVESVALFSTSTGALLHELSAPSLEFGAAVAVSGNRVFCGAPRDAELGFDKGAVFEFDATTGALIRKYQEHAGGYFGIAVAAQDGLLVVGARFGDGLLPNVGAAFVYDVATGALLHHLQSATPAITSFGRSVAIDGSRIVVGAPLSDLGAGNAGSCEVFDALTGARLAVLQEPVPSSNAEFGTSVAIADGRIAVGAPGSSPTGSVVVFDAQTFALEYELSAPPPPVTPSLSLGRTIALGGGHLLVGRRGLDDEVVQGPLLYDAATGALVHVYEEPGDDVPNFDDAVALDATRAALSIKLHSPGSTYPGTLRVHALAAPAIALLDVSGGDGAATDQFGSIDVDGGVAIVGAPFDDDVGPDSGTVVLIDVDDGSVLAEVFDPELPAEGFGKSLAISGARAIVGDPDDDELADNAGAAWIVDVPSGALLHKLLPVGITQPSARFGIAVDVDGSRAIVGAHRVGQQVGAAYVFDVTTGAQTMELVSPEAAPQDRFGFSVAAGPEHFLVGAIGANGAFFDDGAVFVFDRTSGAFLTKLVADNDVGVVPSVGRAVAVDGPIAVIGSPRSTVGQSTVHVFDLASGLEILELVGEVPDFGTDVAVDFGAGGLQILVGTGAPTVAAQIFDGATGNLLASHPVAGPAAVDVALDDARAFVGLPELARVDVYDRPEPPPTAYCSAKLSSAGCVNSIGASAPTAPVSGANDFLVTCASVQGGKNGVLFAGRSGPAAIPFSGGILCVTPPLKRGPILGSGGSGPGACDGSFQVVVNDGSVIPLGLDPGLGGTAWYQWWYRDPQNGAGALGTALSDGLRLTAE